MLINSSKIPNFLTEIFFLSFLKILMLVKLEKPKKLLKKQKQKFKVCQNGKKIRPFIHFNDYLSSTTYCLNIFTSLRGQTWHFVNCKGIPQQVKNRIVAESATLLSFFDFFFLFRIPRTNNIR